MAFQTYLTIILQTTGLSRSTCIINKNACVKECNESVPEGFAGAAPAADSVPKEGNEKTYRARNLFPCFYRGTRHSKNIR